MAKRTIKRAASRAIKAGGPVYMARPNTPITDKQAQLVGRERDRMVAEGIAPTARNFLRRVSAESNPLHKKLGFTWDNRKAAELHRLDWARVLLGSVVEVEISSAAPHKAFYSVDTARGDGPVQQREYRTRREVLDDANYTDQVSVERYFTAAAAARDVRALGICKGDRAWRRICDAIEQNEPAAVGRKRIRDAGKAG